MAFLYPTFLFALSAIAIPIIIHLFRFRTFKTIYFSNIKFLKNLQKQTQSKSKLKHLIVLIIRILTIISIVFAFAQPFIPVSDSQKNLSDNEYVCIYIDNSFSMNAQGKKGNLLEEAKNKAQSIVKAYNPTTKFLFITNDFENKHQHFTGSEQIEEFINTINVSPMVRKLSQIVERQIDFLISEKIISSNTSNLLKFYLISDYQKNTSDFDNLKKNEKIQLILIPVLSQNINNLYIDSCWFDSPVRALNQPEELHVKITNKGEEDIDNIPVELQINDTVKTVAGISVKKQNSNEVVLTYSSSSTGIHNGKLQITDYPVTFDNSLYFSYSISDSLSVLVLGNQSNKQIFDGIFKNSSYFKLDYFSENNIITSEFTNYHTIFVNEIQSLSSGLIDALVNYIKTGGTLVFIPNINGDIPSYNQLMNQVQSNTILSKDTTKTKIENLNYKHYIYKNVFKKVEQNAALPTIYQHYKFSNQTATNDEVILSTLNNHKILSCTNFEKGKIFVFALPFELKYSNLSLHQIFVPAIVNFALYSQAVNSIYQIIEKNNLVEIKNQNYKNLESFHIINKNHAIDFIPTIQLLNRGNQLKFVVNNILKLSGNYQIVYDKKPVKSVSFNYNHNESDISHFSTSDLNEIITKKGFKNMTQIEEDSQLLSHKINQLKSGTLIWKWFIITALLLFILEVAIIRLWKTS